MVVKIYRIYFIIFFEFVRATIDINFAEYQYLADHLTERECRNLVTALHFKEFSLPNGLDIAEEKLPRDVSCMELLLHWNSLSRGGKGETHVQVSHRLNQIGREDLARWLTRTVFGQLSSGLRNSLTSSKEREITGGYTTTEFYENYEVFIDEAAWWRLDTFLSIVFVFGLAALFSGAVFLCYLCMTRKRKCGTQNQTPINKISRNT